VTSSLDAAAGRAALAHVLWLGGAPDAGKTTVARALARRFGLRLYLLDDAQPAHWARATPAREPRPARERAPVSGCPRTTELVEERRTETKEAAAGRDLASSASSPTGPRG
jgi:hypothetical protein